MKKVTLVEIAKLRVSIGLLGEIQKPPWWPSAFFSPNSDAFLNPIFSKTTFLARYHGVREAASRIHDQHIGIGANVFHLFRLPEYIERDLHELMLNDELISELTHNYSDSSHAMEYLHSISNPISVNTIGPVRIASISDLLSGSSWQNAAGHYLHAFHSITRVFPFFSESQ